MRPDKLTVHDLFQRERRYVVPLYQRAYVWTKNEQWEPLWEDIERNAEDCLDAESQIGRRSHFLGAIVLNVSKIVGAGVARSEVIDGQQRLTTLQIFIAALRDYAAKIGSDQEPILRRLTVNEEEKKGSDASYKVWPTNADRELFQIIQNAGSPENLLNFLGVSALNDIPRMASAYLYFSERIVEFAEKHKDPGVDAVFGLRQALRTALQLVVIELEEEDDPQVIFETLNARGQPLLPSDLIRNYVFLQAANDPKYNADELYKSYWQDFDNRRVQQPLGGEDRFWHIAERQGRLTRPRIDLFLFHYLTLMTERELNIGQLFREFRDWRVEQSVSTDTLLVDIRRFSKIFVELIEPKGSDRVAEFSKRLKSLDTSTVYPFLLYILSMPSSILPEANRDQILSDIESWLVRRFICQLTNKNYNRFFVSLLVKVKRADEGTDIAELVRLELAKSKENGARWPSDEEFRHAWLYNPIYTKSRADRVSMILRALELKQRTSRNEAISLPERLTIEHLLPQNGQLDDYAYAPIMPALLNENDEQTRQRILHTIGNLTLLTGELNSSVSNGAWPQKTLKIAADSDLRLNAWLRSPTPPVWHEQFIMQRGAELFQQALNIWPAAADAPEDENGTPDDDVSKSQWQVTDAVVLRQKRQALINSLAHRENVSLSADSAARFRSSDNGLRATIAVSKRYSDRPDFPYWYAFHPAWKEYLEDGERSYAILGCVDSNEGYAIPFEIFQPLLANLNTTVREDTGKLHWHIHIVERNGEMGLWLPQLNATVDLSPYKIQALELETEH
ncbi:DUF262 domain-containing protein [Brucella anthropi]|uniref:DUF262 domain-containing protein n=1 Tax=Brucella anthropi TaxID=529 RepID=UPI00124E5B52|nr:DUF262 domain-containing protein [Brucella anthropi]KAB2728006.1 DUF262 domain-containing protein [Brucella anthropi]KAB2745178.1 DUF262 domain-containing protein [Brucella anthropi]KAB2805603.1 DUF262 domain-containing protein [Brucella anthropi]